MPRHANLPRRRHDRATRDKFFREDKLEFDSNNEIDQEDTNDIAAEPTLNDLSGQRTKPSIKEVEDKDAAIHDWFVLPFLGMAVVILLYSVLRKSGKTAKKVSTKSSLFHNSTIDSKPFARSASQSVAQELPVNAPSAAVTSPSQSIANSSNFNSTQSPQFNALSAATAFPSPPEISTTLRRPQVRTSSQAVQASQLV